MIDSFTIQQLAQIVIRGVASGKSVDIEGLGAFHPDPSLGFRFEPFDQAKVFIAYAREDAAQAEYLYDELKAAGLSPWMDTRRLLPGQNWPRAIEHAIDTSDFFLACFSENSVNKRGGFQAEIRYALDCARRLPLDEIFVIPVRLNVCRVPRSIQVELQQVDLFPDQARGIEKIVRTIRGEIAKRQAIPSQ
ncbi:MAG TPA: TIR domain-containing protein [Bryobacteraceae bacterium]